MLRFRPTWWHHAIFIAVLSCAVGVIRNLRHDALRAERHAIQTKAQEHHFQSLVRSWNRHTYVPFTEALLTNINIKLRGSPVQPTARQETALCEAISRSFQYYRAPSFPAYCAFHTNTGVSSTLEINGRLGDQKKFYQQIQKREFPENPVDCLARLWELNHVDQDSAKTNAIIAIWTNGPTVFLTTVRGTNTNTKARATKLSTVLYNAPNSGFRPAETPESIYQRFGSNLFADVYFLGKTSASTNGGPFMISYYWSPAQACWLHSAFYCDAQTGFSTMF